MLVGAIAQYFFGITIFITSVFLVLLVLVQRGRGGGLTGALGGPGGQSAFGTKAGDLFTRITVVVATIWIFLCASAVFFLNPATDPANAFGVEETSEAGDMSPSSKDKPASSTTTSAADASSTSGASSASPAASTPSLAAPGAAATTPSATPSPAATPSPSATPSATTTDTEQSKTAPPSTPPASAAGTEPTPASDGSKAPATPPASEPK